ncbi:MAG: geranylgeranylglyceryl/heptaprenylglyceryl phosphate synthase [Bacteroidales bacterium]|nr:geranylgeranylglyceryl/heptaprenylglyceryl phosphate synthase [Bacteroidales bacterium]MBS3773644.1 geranylgeranylglyceryl/heptaprenylglyceryl phosphate synthase [Bacteroidales bacterium]
MIYNTIIHNYKKRKLFSLHIDPEKYDHYSLDHVIKLANDVKVDFILTGGSLLSDTLDHTIKTIKSSTDIPIVLFPGNLMQISHHADGILFLSLISGRNPDLLIGNHVLAANMLKKSSLEVIPTGYILINGGKTSSVEYISNTKPIPEDKPEIISSTAMAGELLGHRLIYLESGSGASQPVYSEVIKHVKEHVNLPLIVGGGLKTPEDVQRVCRAGADMVVVGNAIEINPESLKSMASVIKEEL